MVWGMKNPNEWNMVIQMENTEFPSGIQVAQQLCMIHLQIKETTLPSHAKLSEGT